MRRVVTYKLVMVCGLSVYMAFVPSFVPDLFGTYLMKSMTYEKLVPIVPQAGTKVKPIGMPFRWVLMTLVPIKINLITNQTIFVSNH